MGGSRGITQSLVVPPELETSVRLSWLCGIHAAAMICLMATGEGGVPDFDYVRYVANAQEVMMNSPLAGGWRRF